MKKRLLAALMAGAMALTMTACGGSSSGSDDSNAASGSDSGSAGSYKEALFSWFSMRRWMRLRRVSRIS